MTLREHLAALNARATSRERALVGIGALVVAAALGYTLVWQPVSGDLVRTKAALATTRAQADRMRNAAGEIAGLARESRAPRTPDLRAAAERAVTASGLRGELTAIDAQEGRVRLTFAAVDFASLMALVERLGREEQLFTVEALLAARVEPGSVRAELALSRPR